MESSEVKNISVMSRTADEEPSPKNYNNKIKKKKSWKKYQISAFDLETRTKVRSPLSAELTCTNRNASGQDSAHGMGTSVRCSQRLEVHFFCFVFLMTLSGNRERSLTEQQS